MWHVGYIVKMQESPLRRFRQPRFSVASPNENNCPTFPVEQENGDFHPLFARQLASSPTKYSDRSVLFLLGNKISSSVPGRRSSMGCIREGRSGPIIQFHESTDEEEDDLIKQPTETRGRSQSVRAFKRPTLRRL